MKRLAALAFSLLLPALAGAQQAYRLGDLEVRPGSVESGRVEVPGTETFIPVSVAHGARPGPVLTLIAGVHGSEYSPILALHRLRPMLDPAEISGTVVMVHMANLPAFQRRTIYYSPDDWGNLNRSFPGKADGAVRERIAHTLTQQLIAPSDYMMDIHSGDANEWLRPSWTGYYATSGGERVIEDSRRMAMAFGLDTIVAFDYDLDAQGAPWCGSTAVSLGVPSIDVEAGEMGLIDDQPINQIVDGIRSVMRELDMAPGEPEPAVNPFIVRERSFVGSDHDGVWDPNPDLRAGDYVHEGLLLGTVQDFHGRPIEEIRAPKGGLLMILIGTPPVNAGDSVAVIAHP